MTTALRGARVVELGGGIAAPFATRLLALLGADVVKIEPPDGDPLRAWGPFPDDVADADRGGGLFRYLNTDKRCVVADLGALADAARVRDLLVSADVVVEHLGVGRLEACGLGPDALGSNQPVGLVRISAAGQDGPLAGVPTTGLVLQALGGWVSSHGIPGTHPVQVGGRLHEYAAGAYAAAAALTAWRAARRRGAPVVADLSMLECLVGTLAYPMLLHESFVRLGLPSTDARRATIPGIVRASDGWVGINALTGQHWQDICAMVDAPEWAGRQSDLAWGGPDLDAFYGRLQGWLDHRSVEEIVALCQAFRIPAAPVGDGATIPGYPQLRERSFFVAEPDGDLVFPGPPWRLSATPAGSTRPATPLHAATPVSGAPPRPFEAPAVPSTDLPFTGLRVLDLGTFWAGPYVGMYLGALGADVVKVESVQRPDGFRFSGAFPQEGADWYERSGVWQATNLDKRDVTLDLTRDEGRELLRGLVTRADVVIENFSPRVVEQFGLDFDALRALRPDVVMLRMPGFGLAGPWRDYVGWAMAFEQASGMAQVTGYPPTPMHPGGFLDPVVGMLAAVAVQAALEHRARTGEGQMVEVAQLEAAVGLSAEQLLDHAMNGRVQGRLGNRHPRLAPQGVYRCADERLVALSVRDDADWAALLEVLDHPLWAVAGMATAAGRQRHHDELDGHLAAWAAGRPAAAALDALRARDLPAGVVLTAPDMYDDAQLVARGYYVALEHPLTGTRRYPGWPMRFSFGGPHHHRPPPTLGQHNAEVLAEVGVDPAELERLVAARVIGRHMVGAEPVG